MKNKYYLDKGRLSVAILLIMFIGAAFVSCKKEAIGASNPADIKKTGESSKLFASFSKSAVYNSYSQKEFGELLPADVKYIVEDGQQMMVVPIKDQYVNNSFYKRGMVSFFDETINDFKYFIVEINVPVSELERVKNLSAGTRANLTGSMKLYSANGDIYAAAEYRNGFEILPADPTGPSSSGGWFGCMKKFFGSDAGTAVTVLGIAGGMGCVACSGAAGAITGVAAIGCLAAIRHADVILQPVPSDTLSVIPPLEPLPGTFPPLEPVPGTFPPLEPMPETLIPLLPAPVNPSGPIKPWKPKP